MKKKTLTLMLAFVLVIGCTIGGTVAWLSAQTDAVVNTFTLGDINITLHETTAEHYTIIPGGKSAKDPTITVKSGSEKCYVYAIVENQLKRSGQTVVTPNIDPDKWMVVDASADKTLYRYCQIVDAANADVILPVFTEVTYADCIEKTDLPTLNDKTITIQGYAHQSDNTDQLTADTAAKQLLN